MPGPNRDRDGSTRAAIYHASGGIGTVRATSSCVAAARRRILVTSPPFVSIQPDSETPSDDVKAALVIATRNRVAELVRTLGSIRHQREAEALLIVVVDGSDDGIASEVRATVNAHGPQPTQYLRFEGAPAATRQRNAGLDVLPSDIDVVHFVDDDVVLHAGYFAALHHVLARHPHVAGVGGLIRSVPADASRHPSWIRHAFLLSASIPGRVLPSGQTTSAQIHPPHVPVAAQPLATQWLSTCSSAYRANVFRHVRFDPRVEGASPRLEDLDFSFRVGRRWPLLFVPQARLTHEPSTENRRGPEATAFERVVRRCWFVRKNLRHPMRWVAFWWSALGQLLALAVSRHPHAPAARRGFLRGVAAIVQRDHPLLR